MKQHVDTIGIVLVVWGAIQLVSTLFIGLFVGVYGGLGAIMALAGINDNDHDLMVGGLFVGGFGLIMMIPLALMLISGLLPIAGGFGMLKRKPWARPVGFAAAGLSLINFQWFPFGLIVGVFAILVLVDPEVTAEFAGDVPKF